MQRQRNKNEEKQQRLKPGENKKNEAARAIYSLP